MVISGTSIPTFSSLSTVLPQQNSDDFRRDGDDAIHRFHGRQTFESAGEHRAELRKENRSPYSFLLYRSRLSGTNTRSSTPQEMSAGPRSDVPSPFIRERLAVRTYPIGLMSTNAFSQPGMVVGSAKMLLAKVSSDSSSMPSAET